MYHVCVRACGRACVRPCVRACVHACVRACVRACLYVPPLRSPNGKTDHDQSLHECVDRSGNDSVLKNSPMYGPEWGLIWPISEAGI